MKRNTGKTTDQPRQAPATESVVALLAAAGLRAERVERCPDPGCLLCTGDRAAA
jgi:predicted RNA-binding Zn ribbon-like protein